MKINYLIYQAGIACNQFIAYFPLYVPFHIYGPIKSYQNSAEK